MQTVRLLKNDRLAEHAVRAELAIIAESEECVKAATIAEHAFRAEAAPRTESIFGLKLALRFKDTEIAKADAFTETALCAEDTS